MSAPRLKKLRVRGTNAQRYTRLQKWCRRKANGKRGPGQLPSLRIDYFALWRARYPRGPSFAKHVNITVTVGPRDDAFDLKLDEVGNIAYCDDGIEIVKRAVLQAIQEKTRQGEFFVKPELGVPWPPRMPETDLPETTCA